MSKHIECEPAFEILPKALHHIIWDYIGCGCVCDELMEFGKKKQYSKYGNCYYQHTHKCDGSINCKRTLDTFHYHVCPPPTRNTPMLMGSVYCTGGFQLFFRATGNKSDREYMCMKIKEHDGSDNPEKTVHGFCASLKQ